MVVILTEVRWDLNVALTWISFIAKDVEHFFIYLLAISTSSFENCPFNSFAHFLIGLFVLLVFNFLISLYILDSNTSNGQLAKTFLPFVRVVSSF
jgi:NADH:ubiquinone oxidoreductase subunit 3 (subunit A)